MIVAWIPFVFALVGLVMYVAAPPPNVKIAEIGRILFFCGMLVTMMTMATKTLHLG